jgi:hypothetical protein
LETSRLKLRMNFLRFMRFQKREVFVKQRTNSNITTFYYTTTHKTDVRSTQKQASSCRRYSLVLWYWGWSPWTIASSQGLSPHKRTYTHNTRVNTHSSGRIHFAVLTSRRPNRMMTGVGVCVGTRKSSPVFFAYWRRSRGPSRSTRLLGHRKSDTAGLNFNKSKSKAIP